MTHHQAYGGQPISPSAPGARFTGLQKISFIGVAALLLTLLLPIQAFAQQTNQPCLAVVGLSPQSGPPGTETTMSGTNLAPNQTIRFSAALYGEGPNGRSKVWNDIRPPVKVSSSGSFSAKLTVPKDVPKNPPKGVVEIRAHLSKLTDACNAEQLDEEFKVTKQDRDESVEPIHEGLEGINNRSWAGYAVRGSVYSNVKGSWVQPKAVCSKDEDSIAGFWVGLGGLNEPLEQTGTTAECVNGKPLYRAWYEMVHGTILDVNKQVKKQEGATFLSPSVYPVKPGDTIKAEVVHRGKGIYQLKLSSSAWKQGFEISRLSIATDVEPNSAEWIAELPNLEPGSKDKSCQTCRFAKFTTGKETVVNFSDVSVDEESVRARGPDTHRVLFPEPRWPWEKKMGTGSELRRTASDSSSLTIDWLHSRP